ncbi:membrane hypothetical protein [Verrucomicrobia bacterium]|nr:membrane hypothetical protein [Verrucomicrobiota bacterium]
MTSLLQYAEGKPLGISILALIASLPSMVLLFTRTFGGFGFDWGAAAICVLSLGLSLAAVLNLIRAENRGCSSTKIGLSVTALFFALVPEIGLAVALFRAYGNP